LSGAEIARFEFKGQRSLLSHGARLRVHTADQANPGPTVIQVIINERTVERTLPKGLGLQRSDPAHRAFPVTLDFDLAGSDLREAANTLSIQVKGDGWFSWDALDLVGKP